jgi:hypothetical protein
MAVKAQGRAFNFQRGELSQEDKEVIVEAARELPAWGRIFLYGETRLGSAEENAALLALNDGMWAPLFVETARGTMKMIRHNSAVVRLSLPQDAYRRAWDSESDWLGLPVPDRGEEFILEALEGMLPKSLEEERFPYRKFGVLRPGQKESDSFNLKYLGAVMLFRKPMYRDVTLPEWFASLPRGWFSDMGMRSLSHAERVEIARVRRPGRGRLFNGEIALLDTLVANNDGFERQRR